MQLILCKYFCVTRLQRFNLLNMLANYQQVQNAFVGVKCVDLLLVMACSLRIAPDVVYFKNGVRLVDGLTFRLNYNLK